MAIFEHISVLMKAEHILTGNSLSFLIAKWRKNIPPNCRKNMRQIEEKYSAKFPKNINYISTMRYNY
ncbi:MAG: hypothetical protein PUI58_02630, partial [Solobacterium sp.]|nr:hypothetical protein [Solobacterium sp.]